MTEYVWIYSPYYTLIIFISPHYSHNNNRAYSITHITTAFILRKYDKLTLIYIYYTDYTWAPFSLCVHSPLFHYPLLQFRNGLFPWRMTRYRLCVTVWLAALIMTDRPAGPQCDVQARQLYSAPHAWAQLAHDVMCQVSEWRDHLLVRRFVVTTTCRC